MRTLILQLAVFGLGALRADAASAQQAAARTGDSGAHAGSTIVTGVSSVRINGAPAANVGAVVTCPLVCPFPGPAHGPGTITSGSTTVRIGGAPAAVVTSAIVEPAATCAPVHGVVSGSPNVLIGP